MRRSGPLHPRSAPSCERSRSSPPTTSTGSRSRPPSSRRPRCGRSCRPSSGSASTPSIGCSPSGSRRVFARTRSAMAAATAYGHALVLEPFAGHHFAHPDLLIEGMRRGWEAAVGQPRYGPNGREVRALIERFRRATPDEGAALVRGWAALGITEDPWPAGRVAVRLRGARGLGGARAAGRRRGAGSLRPVRGGPPRTRGGVRADGPCDHAAPGVLRARSLRACGAPGRRSGSAGARTPAGADGAAGSGPGRRAALGRELGRQRRALPAARAAVGRKPGRQRGLGRQRQRLPWVGLPGLPTRAVLRAGLVRPTAPAGRAGAMGPKPRVSGSRPRIVPPDRYSGRTASRRTRRAGRQSGRRALGTRGQRELRRRLAAPEVS